MKIKWKVQSAPTGRYASFQERGWPDAEFENGDFAASITCETEYNSKNAKTSEHPELKVWVTVDKEITVEFPCTWKRVALTKRPATIEEAKALVKAFYEYRPRTNLKSV